MSDELIDIYNEKNEPTGIQKWKSEAHRLGLWHRAAHIWIYNHQKEILLQLRAKVKDLHPELWDVSSAGHVSAGEEPIKSALRELEEEIGLVVKQEDLKFYKILKSEADYPHIKNKEFYYIYILEYNGDISCLKLQESEVDAIQFYSIENLEKELKSNPKKFVPHGKYYDEVIGEIKKK